MQYGFIGLFLAYLYCLDHFLGEWLKSTYEWISEAAHNIGMVELSYTISSLGHNALNGAGMFVTALVLSCLTVALIGTETFEEIESNASI